MKQVAPFECQCWRNALYSWKECVKVIDIPNQLYMVTLRKQCKKFRNILELIFVRIKLNWALPQQKKNNQTIVKYSWRKGCGQMMWIKKDLKDLNPTDLDLSGRDKAVHKW